MTHHTGGCWPWWSRVGALSTILEEQGTPSQPVNLREPVPTGSVTSASAATMSANSVSEHGLTPDLGPRSDVRTTYTLQHGGMIEVGELTKQVRHDVFRALPRRSGLARVLTCMGATVRAESGRGLLVTGIDPCRIASAAAARHIPIQELRPRSVSGKRHLRCGEHGDPH